MVAEAVCQHHWMLPSPHGTSTITAVCKHCGEKKEQPTSQFTIDVLGVHPGLAASRAAREGRKEMAAYMHSAMPLIMDHGKPEGQSWKR